MNETLPKQRISLGLLAVILIPTAGGFIAWGSNSTKVAEIERHVDYQDAQVQQVRSQLVESQRAIAVEDTQYAEILRRLDQIDHKIDTRP